MTTFAELAKINVNAYVEKKGEGDRALSYLSWVKAVELLLTHDPEANWEYSYFGDPAVPFLKIPAGESDYTAMVICTVKAFGRERTVQLPVMDHRNRAIVNPNAMEVNTAMQRCLAKAIALHGIGLYVYAGEDLPTEIAEEARALRQKIEKANPEQLAELTAEIGAFVEAQPELRSYLGEAFLERKAALEKRGIAGLKDRIKTTKQQGAEATNG